MGGYVSIDEAGLDFSHLRVGYVCTALSQASQALTPPSQLVNCLAPAHRSRRMQALVRTSDAADRELSTAELAAQTQLAADVERYLQVSAGGGARGRSARGRRGARCCYAGALAQFLRDSRGCVATSALSLRCAAVPCRA